MVKNSEVKRPKIISLEVKRHKIRSLEAKRPKIRSLEVRSSDVRNPEFRGNVLETMRSNVLRSEVMGLKTPRLNVLGSRDLR